MAGNELINKTEVTIYPPAKKGSIALTKMAHVRTELSKLYREARTGKIDISDATKLTFMLQVLAKIIEGGEMEKRIEALEQAQPEGGKYGGY